MGLRPHPALPHFVQYFRSVCSAQHRHLAQSRNADGRGSEATSTRVGADYYDLGPTHRPRALGARNYLTNGEHRSWP